MTNRSRWSLAAMGISFFWVILLAIWGKGGYLHPESSAFLRIYTAPDRPFWQIIFDPVLTDWGLYQARELSYLVDCMDAWFISKSILLGGVHFYSLSCALILLGCVAVQQWGFQRDFPHLPPWTALLISTGFVLAPCCGNLVFFRSAKPLVTLAATLLCFETWHLFRIPVNKNRGTIFLIAGILLLAPLADRQGLFLTAVSAGLTAAALIFFSFPATRRIFSIGWKEMFLLKRLGEASLSALCLATLYALYLAPACIQRLNGYLPSFAYQNIGTKGLVNFSGGGLYLFDNIGFFFLHIASPVSFCCGILLISGWFFWWGMNAGKAPGKIVPGMLAVASLVAMFICSMLMTFRHPMMLQGDVIHSSYFMPMLTILLFFAAVSCETAKHAKKSGNVLAGLLLLSCFSAGIARSLSGNSGKGHLKFYTATAPLLRKALSDPGFNAERVILPYGALKVIHHFRNMESTVGK